MQTSLRAFAVIGALVLASVVGAAACGTLDEQAHADAGSCVGLSCGPSDAARDQVVADVPTPDGGGDAATPTRNPLCATTGCLPGDLGACGGGGAGDAGAGDASNDASLDAGAGDDAGDASAPGLACAVVHGDAGVETTCVPSGNGVDGSPCVSSADCAAGFACVGDANASQCRAYCCGDPDACPKDTYCAEKVLRDAAAEPKQSVPVCVPADKCSLDEPYPCPAGKQCKCKDGTACAVVKDDTTTSCVPPGTGVGGESCPCAPGFVCSFATQTCLKLCSTSSGNPDCGSGKCLSVAYLPAGFGVCGLGASDGGY